MSNWSLGALVVGIGATTGALARRHAIQGRRDGRRDNHGRDPDLRGRRLQGATHRGEPGGDNERLRRDDLGNRAPTVDRRAPRTPGRVAAAGSGDS